MNLQAVILKEALDLLGCVLEKWPAQTSGDARNVRKAFINRHAWNIHELAGDVLVLEAAGKLGSIYLLSRPALESLFKLGAAVQEKEFAAQKVVAEVEEEAEKIGHWLDIAGPDLATTLNEMIRSLREFGADLRKRYGVSGQKRWKIFEAAKLGDLQAEYVQDYFAGSRHVHAMLSALTAREDELYVPEALFGLTANVVHASALVNKALMELENGAVSGVFETATEIRRRARREYDRMLKAQTAMLKAQGY